MSDTAEQMGVTAVRNNLRSVLKKVEREQAQVIIMNNGEPVAALIPLKDFHRIPPIKLEDPQ
ncbi:type II toxin-antitoxin system Phd/YefM family antitoxin [Deinococcus deserti]|uniref:type II toxin-antitoxin system Phd/YefM family antitoxin n=1 Tax=Deinococcus deserti TaxID=310783 RepID=UPI001877540D|nr:type II toxin-antitoxin system Phd/YefM family antitoxin [Deinococcus deserti]